jgi:replicative DNA helicase
MNTLSSEHLRAPAELDAEKSLLGMILLNSKVLEDVADVLQPQHFYDMRHQIVYNVMIDLWSTTKPVDVLFILDELKVKKGLKQSEVDSIDKEFLVELVSRSSLSNSPSKAADIIKDKFLLRTVINIADTLKAKALDEKDRVDDVLDYAQKKIYELSEQNIDKNFTPISEVLHTIVERIGAAAQGDVVEKGAAIPTGLMDMDALLGGLHRSDLIILAARPSMGKTSLALEIVRRAATHHAAGVAFFSLEMSKEQLVDKLISSQSGIPLSKIRHNQLENGENGDEFRMLGEAIGVLSEAPIWIDDSSGGLNITELRTKARRLKSRYNIGLVVVDYLQLMRGFGSVNYGVNRVQEVSDISRALKMLAKELDIPVMALSQLSRGVESREDKRPLLSDLRESGSIEQDADIVMFVHREEFYNKETKNKGKANIIVAKHRNGETGTVELAWVGRLATFANLEGARVGHRIEK